MSPLDRLRELIEAHTPESGPNLTAFPGLIFYRGECRTDPRRGEADSLALALVVQGSKKVRVGSMELEYGPGQVLVLTRSLSFDTWVTKASRTKPYLSMYQSIAPNLVAETLIELSAGVSDGSGTAPGSRSGAVSKSSGSSSGSRSSGSRSSGSRSSSRSGSRAGSDTGSAPGANASSSSVTQTHPDEVYVTDADADLLGAAVRLVRTLDDPTERSVLAPLVLREIVFRLLRSDAAAGLRRTAGNGDDDLRIREAMRYMEAHAKERLTVLRVARAVAMSPSHFAHRFRDVARVTPMQYLKHVRLREARLLLLEEGARAAEAGKRVGYRSPAHFSRDFVQAFGVAPSRYAERFRSGGG